jgi:metal-responsive CopG/Arc/MetJ family transcriptional regulator
MNKKKEKKRLCITISKELMDQIDLMVNTKSLDKSKLIEKILRPYFIKE